jgi:hypothetical protein
MAIVNHRVGLACLPRSISERASLAEAEEIPSLTRRATKGSWSTAEKNSWKPDASARERRGRCIPR